MSKHEKVQALLRFHRQHVFDDGAAGDRHHRALLRIKKTRAFAAMCDDNRAHADHIASERLLRAWA
jgi:hypothetical protein